MDHHQHHHSGGAACAHCASPPGVIRLGKRLRNVALLFLTIFALSFLPALEPLNTSLLSYLGIIWWAILLGLLLGGIIDYFIPESFIIKYLGRRSPLSLLYAVVSGFLLSACSHGILAIAIQLYKKGASVPAVITFLLATPWANLPVTILLFGFFGWKALIFILLAMLVALITGLIFLGLDRAGLIEESLDPEQPHTIDWSHLTNFNAKKSFRGVTSGAMNLANMVLWWILIGVLAAALIGAYVPHHIFMQFFGPTFTGLLLTLLFATIIEVCSEGSAPIAFEIFTKTGALGNPFVFLMAGVATDYTEIGLLWSNIGKKTALWLPAVTVPQIVLLGYFMNQLL